MVESGVWFAVLGEELMSVGWGRSQISERLGLDLGFRLGLVEKG